jgi:hypothetical protein
MNRRDPSTDPAPAADPGPEMRALQEAVDALMAPLARLAVARGLPYATVEDMLKKAFVQAASAAHPGLLAHRKVSRISTATGINRREVSRLTQLQTQARPAPRQRSLASEVFTHWLGQPPYRAPNGQARPLPRQGPAPSFETLSHQVTRDVHPRSLLDELCRLGLAQWDEASDTVTLVRDVFVPQGDRARKLAFLGDNVGDHLRAAIDNVLADDRSHFEQAVFADGLSAASLEVVRPAVREQWQTLMATLVPLLEARVASDAQSQPPPKGRVRIGVYSYQELEAAGPGAAAAATAVVATAQRAGSARRAPRSKP